MAIEKLLTTPNNEICEYHEVRSAQVDYLGYNTPITYTVYSFTDYSTKMQGASAKYAWNETGQLTTADLVDIETSLISLNTTPFFGGTLVDTKQIGIQREKILKHSEVNKTFNSLVSAPLEVGTFGIFDADRVAISNVVAAIEIMRIKESMGDASAITWTLYDNSTVELTLANLQQVLITGAIRDAQLRAIKNQLRAEIETASTQEEVKAISWPQ